MVVLEVPTNILIDSYIHKFSMDERYYPADNAIIKLFKAFPRNILIEDILLKICVLNDMYSTNIFATFTMAKHIQKLGIDKSLKNGDTLIVNKIATGHGIKSTKNNREINFYSFATKYCNWHNQEQYAIYDRFVEKILLAYKQRDNFSDFSQPDLKVFPEFKRIILEFIEFYGLTGHNLKQIDKFLWMYGKEKYPTKY
jgi:hypothetical protein